MLTEIMKAFRQTGDPLDINELSRQLGTERSVLEGMLEQLVRQGKLREVRLVSEECAHRSGRSECSHLQSGNIMGKVYELVDKPGEGGQG